MSVIKAPYSMAKNTSNFPLKCNDVMIIYASQRFPLSYDRSTKDSMGWKKRLTHLNSGWDPCKCSGTLILKGPHQCWLALSPPPFQILQWNQRIQVLCVRFFSPFCYLVSTEWGSCLDRALDRCKEKNGVWAAKHLWRPRKLWLAHER